MQKTYDECYLICSTAVYFEGQNNEEEALRSWRSALDRIYYHNAYKVAPNYQPGSATEKALQDSLHQMELQCKERVTLLEALKKSREETEESSEEKAKREKKEKKEEKKAQKKLQSDAVRGPRPLPRTPSSPIIDQPSPGWIGNGTVPPVNYNDIPSPLPTPTRPRLFKSRSSDIIKEQLKPPATSRQHSSNSTSQSPLYNVTPADTRQSRTPSPEKKMTTLRTTLRQDKGGKKSAKTKETISRNQTPTAGMKAAGLAWGGQPLQAASAQHSIHPEIESRRYSGETRRSSQATRPLSPPAPPTVQKSQKAQNYMNGLARQTRPSEAPPRPPKVGFGAQQILLDHEKAQAEAPSRTAPANAIKYTKPPPDFMQYRSEYPPPEPVSQAAISAAVNPPNSSVPKGLPPREAQSLSYRSKEPPTPPVSRRPVPKSPASSSFGPASPAAAGPSNVARDAPPRRKRMPQPAAEVTPPSSETESTSPEPSIDSKDWKERLAYVKKNLPKGVDEAAAKSIFNEIVVEGDEVHWEDVAGLDAAKKALKEAVVYPFLRPDLFMGLREPARGMLLFGPPGTGKTMIARACATESKSTFFAISASSLTSKWMGESEKLVRALFQLSKALAPSIIFVDEIDSLLSSRSDGEHETTRRIKTEFLIQWSDLQKAAAGKEAKTEGDATRVLVLAATNLPWAIDEAARRRFVRRQYIPLPEGPVREQQLRTLLGHQKHTLSKNDIKVLVELTDGYSGSDITALAKDAAMGPLRSLGESLLHMSPDEIRPIMFDDFEASLINIRPSVSKDGLKEFEDWATQFGERA